MNKFLINANTHTDAEKQDHRITAHTHGTHIHTCICGRARIRQWQPPESSAHMNVRAQLP